MWWCTGAGEAARLLKREKVSPASANVAPKRRVRAEASAPPNSLSLQLPAYSPSSVPESEDRDRDWEEELRPPVTDPTALDAAWLKMSPIVLAGLVELGSWRESPPWLDRGLLTLEGGEWEALLLLV